MADRLKDKVAIVTGGASGIGRSTVLRFAQWQLLPREAEILKGPVKAELDRLPIPVEPQNIPEQQKRLAGILSKALS